MMNLENLTLGYIWLDLDGTIANLYGVNNWLEDLLKEDVRPYREAQPLYNPNDLLEILLKLKKIGYNLGVVSWLSKTSTKNYDRAVTETKKEWLKKYSLDIVFDTILITEYGKRKSDTCRKYGKGILIDDEERNREEWDLGDTIDATIDILEQLKRLL